MFNWVLCSLLSLRWWCALPLCLIVNFRDLFVPCLIETVVMQAPFVSPVVMAVMCSVFVSYLPVRLVMCPLFILWILWLIVTLVMRALLAMFDRYLSELHVRYFRVVSVNVILFVFDFPDGKVRSPGFILTPWLSERFTIVVTGGYRETVRDQEKRNAPTEKKTPSPFFSV